MKEVILQSERTIETVVDQSQSAIALQSGDVNVFATPMMVALMEHAAKEALRPFLDEGETSVGTMMQTSHDAATPIGMKVSATATIVSVDGKAVTFEVIAHDACGVIGKGTHQRVVVKQARFEERCNAKLTNC